MLPKTFLGYAIRAICSRTFAATVRSAPMGVGTNAARIGGLAVALGIGAAVVAGNGVAWADTSGEPGSESSSTSSTSTDSSTSTGPHSGAKSARQPAPHTVPRPRRRWTRRPDRRNRHGSSSETSSEPSETAQAETPKAPTVSSVDNAEPDNKRHFQKKRTKDSRPSSGTGDPVAASTRSPDAPPNSPVVHAPATAPTKSADDTTAVADFAPSTADAPVVTLRGA